MSVIALFLFVDTIRDKKDKRVKRDKGEIF